MLEVLYRNQKYSLFTSIKVSSTLDAICGQFTIEATPQDTIPFGLGSYIRVLADGFPVVSGYVEMVKSNISNNGNRIVYSGRSILCDLVDSSIPEVDSSTEGDISLQSLCTQVMSSLGLPSALVNLAGDLKSFQARTILSSRFGNKAGAFLQSFAKKRSVVLTNDGSGNLVIFRPPSKVTYKTKLTDQNMLQRETSYSMAQQYNIIEVGSEDNMVTPEDYEVEDLLEISTFQRSVARKQQAEDPSIRSTRFLQVRAEESMTDEELDIRAQDEINLRRAKSLVYSVTVPSHQYVKGRLVTVNDQQTGVSGIFLIKKVEYTSSSEGNISKLDLCYPESYSGRSGRISTRKSDLGGGVGPDIAFVAEPGRELQ